MTTPQAERLCSDPWCGAVTTALMRGVTPEDQARFLVRGHVIAFGAGASGSTGTRPTCSALDPTATARVEELILSLRGRYTIVIVTHNMAQARRISDECVFMLLGEMIEHRRTEDLFLNPADDRTARYIEGRYG